LARYSAILVFLWPFWYHFCTKKNLATLFEMERRHFLNAVYTVGGSLLHTLTVTLMGLWTTSADISPASAFITLVPTARRRR
jgi:hypothetical protein